MILSRTNHSNRNSNFLTILVFIAIIALIVYGARHKIAMLYKTYFTTERAEIEKIVGDYIQSHPKEILQAIQKMQEQEYEEMNKKTKQAIKEKKDEIMGSKNEILPIAGNKDGDVVIITFLDYRCGYCKNVNNVLRELIKQDKQIKVVYRELPVLGPQSQEMAKMALAVYLADPGKYEEFHNQVMDLRSTDQASVDKIIVQMGFDLAEIKEIMKDKRIDQELAYNMELAQQLNIRGTPAFIIGDTLVPGAVDLATMQEIVKDSRKNKR